METDNKDIQLFKKLILISAITNINKPFQTLNKQFAEPETLIKPNINVVGFCILTENHTKKCRQGFNKAIKTHKKKLKNLSKYSTLCNLKFLITSTEVRRD